MGAIWSINHDLFVCHLQVPVALSYQREGTNTLKFQNFSCCWMSAKGDVLKDESSWFTVFNEHVEGCAEHIISVTGWKGQHVSSVAMERGWIWHSSDVRTSTTFLTDDVDFNCTPGWFLSHQLLRDIEIDEAICWHYLSQLCAWLQLQ